MKPAWVTSQLRARHICEQCADRPADTVWTGTGEEICWQCCEKRQDAYHDRTS